MAQKVEYIVEVSRTGTGATEAAAQLNAVDAAAKRLNQNIPPVNNGFTVLKNTSTATSATLKAMQNTAVLLGGTTFPQVTMAALIFKEALVGLKAAAVAAETSLLRVAAPLAVIAWGAMKVFELGQEVKAWYDATANYFESAARAPTDEFLRKQRELVQSRTDTLDLMTAEERLKFEAYTRDIAHLNIELSGGLSKKEMLMQVNAEYERQIRLIRQLVADGKLKEGEGRDLEQGAGREKLQGLIQVKNTLTDIQQLSIQVAQNFASGMSTAIVEFASKTKSAEEAFRQFAVSFLQQTAQMILQLAIMRMLFGASGLSSGTGGLIGGLINGAAAGGQFSPGGARRMAMGGVAELNQPTYFPRFNVLAGEAGREVMTVMARPRLMNVGGIAAQIGDVGPNRLALTNAADLQNLGMGGGQRVHVDLAVHLQPGWEADLIGKSANAGLNLVTRKMREGGQLADNTRRLSQ